jgi:hypothetical protein
MSVVDLELIALTTSFLLTIESNAATAKEYFIFI